MKSRVIPRLVSPFLLVMLMLVALSVTASAQTAQWIRQAGTGGISNGVSSDASGNCYATGTVSNPALFDNVTIACHASDVFVAKYNASGALLWAKVAGGELLDQGNAIATDANGNSYVAGAIQTNGIYPTVSFDNITLTGHGDYDWFIAKYDVSGNVLWAKSAGSNLGDIARGVALDGFGNVYVCGLFSGMMTVDGVTVTSSGIFDVFLAKYDGNGVLLWLKRAGGTGSDIAHGITTDALGNVAIVGEFQNTASFDSHSVTASGLGDAFIAKYDASGNNLWVRGGGSTTSFATDAAKSIAADASNNLYVTGDYSGVAIFDGLSVPNSGTSGTDIFVSKYDSNGTIQWLHHGGGSHADKGYSIGVDRSGNNWVTGFASSGPGVVFDTISLPPLGNEYVFLARYDAGGVVQYVKQYAAGTGQGIHVLNNGCLYFSGGASRGSGNEFDNISLIYVDRGAFIGQFCEPGGPSPSPTPTPSPGTSATPTPAATPPPVVNISGAVLYCSNPSPNPVSGVTMTLTGSASGSTASDGSGNYAFNSLASGGSCTLTPTKAARVPGSAGINTVDVIAMQRHFLIVGTPLTGCPLTAGDVNGDARVNTVDVLAVQRFFLGLSTGIANVGKYEFSPTSRIYTGVVSDQTGQNYNALTFGDVAPNFANRAGGPSPDGSGVDELPGTVALVALPEIVVNSKSNVGVAVTTSAIDAQNNLVGFQGDFRFDERLVTFQSEPVQKAGITGGNWNVSGNVLPGAGPMRTLRISAYSNDFTPLSGSGTLFELKMLTASDSALRTPHSAFPLAWVASPDGFIFIDADLKVQRPVNAVSGKVDSRR